MSASGADSVITGNLRQGFSLLLKAAASLQVDWYTCYAAGTDGPTRSSRAASQDACDVDWGERKRH
jgi:hypothetical protein